MARRRRWSIAGAVLGGIGWGMWASALPSIPVLPRFLVAAVVLVVGPGAAAATLLARDAPAIERGTFTLAAGLVLSPALAHLLGALDILSAYPVIAAALGGLALGSGVLDTPPGLAWPRRDVLACGLVGGLAVAGGFVAYAHRMSVTPERVILNGDYDTYDSTYYAAISAGLAQHSPNALFHAGHRLGYAYHAQLVPAMIYRFGGVPLLDQYFRYVWPLFLLIAALTIFVTVRQLASTRVALLGSSLVLCGSDFSYVAAYVRPYRAHWNGWDRLMWSNNWLTPGAEQLFFNTWTPALAVLFLGVWMLDSHEKDGRPRWLFASAAAFASLVQFKPFAFAAVITGLVAASVFGRPDGGAKRRFGLVLAGTLVLALPYLAGISKVYDESQAVLKPGVGYASVLPGKVIFQLGLEEPLARLARALGDTRAVHGVTGVAVANLLFFIGGLGARLVGLPLVWRSLRDGEARSALRLLAWTIVAGAAIPLGVVTEPYHQTFHPYHASLYLLWVFVACEAVGRTRGWHLGDGAVIAAVIIAAVPSTVHYLQVKWTDVGFAHIDRDVSLIADRLRQEDPARTVFLQRYPQGPSFVSLLAGRRTVLAWAQYTRNTAPLAAEIDQFFQSAAGDPAEAWSTLIAHHVTHVVETVGRDRIHPDVLGRLEPLLVTGTLRLYAVPRTQVNDGQHRPGP